MAEIQYDHIIVRYGELSTKGKNRKEFTRQLTQNIRKRLSDHESLTIPFMTVCSSNSTEKTIP